VHVLDFSELAPGPFMTQCLVEMGASVTKIERPQGDQARTLQPGGFKVLNVGKDCRRVDLKDAATSEQVFQLAVESDILVEGFRPGVMTRLGLGYDRLRAANPALIYVSITGFGQSGPFAARGGHDINYMAMAGVTALSGGAGQPPKDAIGLPISDFCGSLYALSTTLAALLQVRATGQGQHLDVSIVDCLTHWMNPRLGHFQQARLETLEQQRQDVFNKPGYGVFATADETFVAIASLEDAFWQRLIKALPIALDGIDHSTHARRSEHALAINAQLAAAIRSLPADEVIQRLTAVDVPVSKMVSPSELPTSAHAVARDLFTAVDGIKYARFPVKLT
jgi:crotonobetainyl-CoA:carnitine CoA-transferase CaiB-like acyl-CoA transferase